MPQTFISHLRQTIQAAPGKTITLDTLVNSMGRGSFGVLLLMLGLPSMLPLPGFVSLFGLVLLLLGGQMLLGFQQPWLPQKVRHTALPKTQLLKLLGIINRPMHWLQPYIHRRLPGMVRRYGERAAGIMVILQAIFIIIPLPFTNEAPAACIIVLALAFVQQDGLLAIGAHLLALLSMAGMLALYGGIMLAGYFTVMAWL